MLWIMFVRGKGQATVEHVCCWATIEFEKACSLKVADRGNLASKCGACAAWLPALMLARATVTRLVAVVVVSLGVFLLQKGGTRLTPLELIKLLGC
jgi:hypothetical protein